MMKKIVLIVFLFFGFQMFSQEIQNKNTTICWDVSSSMTERDVEKDFSILEKVFERAGNQEVQLILFNIDTEEKKYVIQNGDWTQLKKDLENVTYEGGTLYNSLKGKIKNQNVYVFTDGQKTLSKDVLSLDGKSFLINSNPIRNTTFLERTALLNKSRLMDFATMLPENVKKLQEKSNRQQQEQKQLLKGTVYIDNKPTSNVKINVKGISDSFLTGPEGGFTIDAQVGDTLVVTSRNNKTVKVVPVEAMAHTNVFLEANIVSLDEVVVVEKQLEEEEELMVTKYGLQNKKALGYTVSEIGEEDISAVQTNVSEAINNKVSGLKLSASTGSLKNTGLERAETRGRNTINMNPYALVVINGVPADRTSRRIDQNSGSFEGTTSGIFSNNSTNRNADYSFIDPGNIAKITVLKGLAATNAYGSEGANGVILITTKTAAGGVAPKQKKDLALMRNNVYDEEQSKQVNDMGVGFEKGISPGIAYEDYRSVKAANQNDLNFHLRAFDFFKNKDVKIAKAIISNILEYSSESLEALRVAASALHAVGDFDTAIQINEEIITRSPNDVNGYFDKAMAKREAGRYQEALNELVALAKGNKYFAVNATEIKKTLDREIKNLIFKNKGQLNTANVDANYLNNLKYKVRLVFEWNEPGSEFELQFVNPKKRFFNWVHTNSEMKGRIEDEIKNNYRMEEYEFYGDVAGEWIINAKYLGDTKKNTDVPLVLKCTVFKDFGYPTQTKEEVIVHFSTQEEKKNIKNLVVN